MSLTANALIFRSLLALVLLAPLPLASNRPWAWSLLAALTGLLLGLWSLLVLSGRCGAPVAPVRLRAAFLLFGGALLWAWAQTSPLLPALLWHPLWSEAAAALGAGRAAGMVSVDPALTVNAILRMLCYGGIFWLAVQLGREGARAREGMVVVVVGCLAYAVYGLIVHFAGWETIVWLKKWTYIGDLTSTFVNRNAYGAYAGLGVVCSVALFLQALRPPRSGQERGAAELAETVLVRGAPYLIVALVLGTALLLSHSRAAFLCTGLALAVLMAALVASRVLRPRLALMLGAMVVAVGVVALAVSGDVTIKRLTETGSAQEGDGRADVYALVVQAIGDAPLTGHGLGAFLPAFQMYRDTTLPEPEEWQYAHNAHLEIAMDLGLPAALALYGAFTLILVACLRGVRLRRRNHIYPATALAAATLLIAHGMVDFSIQMPAVAATLALLLGLGYAQSWSSREGDAASSPEG